MGVCGQQSVKEIENKPNKQPKTNSKIDTTVKDINGQSKNSEIKNKNNLENNYILAEIEITSYNVNQNVRIINSYEEYQANANFHSIREEEKNEDQIKNCEITINDKTIPFNYFHIFKEIGKYSIKYSFKHQLTKTNFMFYECNCLANINLSNFNSKKVTNINCMFYGCESLKNINLSNFNTENVTNMNHLFYKCKSLYNLDLTNFNTQNVTAMNDMFNLCESLTSINLSNFDTQNVTNMSYMFTDCKSLSSLDLSNFNTDNVCFMDDMFSGCESLTYLNLSNFNTQKVSDLWGIFAGCSSLKKESLIAKDERILNEEII